MKWIILIVCIVLIACSEQKATVGVMLPLTGISAALGQNVRQGIELAENQSSHPLNIVFEDDACDAKQGVTAAQKLIDVDHVAAILGPICTTAILSSLQLVEDAHTPRITTGLVLQKTANAGSYHFSFLPEMKHQMNAIAAFKPHAAFGVIAVNDDLGKESIAELKRALVEQGGSVVAEEYFERADTDFRAQLLRINSKNPDSIYLMGYVPNLAGLVRQIHELGIEQPIFTWSLFQDPSILALNSTVEGVIYTYPEDPRALPVKIAFRAAFKQKFGKEPELYAANAYDSYNILANAVETCGYDKECIKTALEHLGAYEGANGFITLDERGVGQRVEVTVKTVKDGKFVALA